MNTELFEDLWKEKKPGQQKQEYFYFLRWLWYHFKGVDGPIVVEIGIRRGAQKRFYEQLFGARHIGIDITSTYAKPDILGNSQDVHTRRELESMLGAQKADLIFIDGDHSLTGVRRDYELYRDLAPIIAIHDIHCTRIDVAAGSFWRSLDKHKMLGYRFIEFFSPEPPDHYGIGVIESLGL